MSSRKLTFIPIIAVLTLLLTLTGCTNYKESSTNKISIVTSTNFYGEVAKEVVGNKGTVTSIIKSSATDPHDYEATTDTAKKVSSADFIIANGLGYDSWLSQLAKNSDGTLISVGEDVMHLKSGANPHIWYNPTMMSKLANQLATDLGKKYPKNKAYFKANAQKYIKSLVPVQNKIDSLKVTEQNNHDVYVSEPVFDYALSSLGYRVANRAFENAIEKDADPSPKSIKAMQSGIKNHSIQFFVDNKQVSSNTVTNMTKLAKQNNIPVLKVTETIPNGMTYKEWMLSQYTQLEKLLTQTN